MIGIKIASCMRRLVGVNRDVDEIVVMTPFS